MITFFNISGCMYYVDEEGRNTGYEDVFVKVDMCRKYYGRYVIRGCSFGFRGNDRDQLVKE